MSGESSELENDKPSGAGSWDADIGRVRVLFGPGRLLEAGDQVSSLDCSRALLVSDPGLEAAGHVESLQRALRAAGIEVALFTDVGENPTTDEVAAGLAAAESFAPDCVVALGGGSAMDCAKGINFLLSNGGKITDYVGFGHAQQPLLPAIGIPTTAGTGSDAQSFALISEASSHRKLACGDPSARFRRVILDPTLLVSAPRRVAAASGLDAVGHAIESFVSTRSNPVSRMLAHQAWRLLDCHLEASLRAAKSVDHLGEIQIAAHLAGAAIEQSMLGAAHACANPLTARFDVPHGQAVALMLPHVVRFNAVTAAAAYQRLAGRPEDPADEHGAGWLAGRIETIRATASLPSRLADVGVPRAAIADLALAAAGEWTAKFNPRPVGPHEIEDLYADAF